MKWRQSLPARILVSHQEDTFSSGTVNGHEHRQNNPRDCKTAFRPSESEEAAPTGPRNGFSNGRGSINSQVIFYHNRDSRSTEMAGGAA